MSRKNVFRAALVGLCLLTPVFGQIVIDWYDIPMVNYTHWNKNIAYNATVNLGSAGGPQTWTFTSQPMGSDSCWNVVIPSSYAPFLDSFPTANLFYATIDGPDSACLYMHLDPTYLATLGFAGQDSSGGVFQKYYVIDTNYLPDHYGDNRHYIAKWRYALDSTTRIEYTKRGYESINAYGTVVIPFNSFPCLRYIMWDTVVQIVYYNNVPVMYDTTTKIGHQFVAENFSGVVCVFSQDNESNPYFTNAAILERLTRFVPGGAVTEREASGLRPRIEIRPNPFNDRTKIRFTIQDPRYRIQDDKNKIQDPGSMMPDKKLQIYDATGRLVRDLTPELISGIMNHGSSFKMDHVSWNGSDQSGRTVPSGIYFVQVETEGNTVTEKIIKTR